MEEPQLGWTEALGEHATNPPQPRMGGEQVIALGRTWTLSSLEQRLKAQFELWVRRNALLAIADAEQAGDLEEAGQLRSTYMGDRGAGYYTWDGKHCRKARSDLPGVRYLLFLLLRRCHPDVTEEQAAAVFKADPQGVAQAMARAQGNSATPVTDAQAPGTNHAKQPVTMDP